MGVALKTAACSALYTPPHGCCLVLFCLASQSGHAYHCFCSSERLDALRTSQKRRGLMPMYDRACLSLTQEEVQAKRDAGESFTIRFKVRRMSS